MMWAGARDLGSVACQLPGIGKEGSLALLWVFKSKVTAFIETALYTSAEGDNSGQSSERRRDVAW
jgi:hypothetical protein